MAFAKKTLDGVAAWKRALASGTARPGYCLAEVHEAFGAPASDRVFPYANATEARVRARQLKAIKGTDLDAAPEGSVLYWSNVIVKGRDLGHIAFKGPRNTIITIDNPTRGRWGQVTVAAFRRKWSWLKFEGYAYGPGAYLGHTVTVATDLKPAPGNSAGGNATPIGDDDMSAKAEQQINSIFDAIFNGGSSMPDDKRSIGQSLADLRNLTAEPVMRNKGDGKGRQAVPVRQDNADTNTMVRELVGRIAGLESALGAVVGANGGDRAVILEAARAGTAEALKSLKLTVEVD